MKTTWTLAIVATPALAAAGLVTGHEGAPEASIEAATGVATEHATEIATTPPTGIPTEPAGSHLMVTPDELEWGPVASMGEGAEIAIIEGDISQPEPFTFRIRLEDGYEILPHIHPAYERVTVLSGVLHFAAGEEFDRSATRRLHEGSVAIMPAGDPMFGYAEGDVVIQIHGTGPWGIEYLDPADDPRN